jgi:hypothetical protein
LGFGGWGIPQRPRDVRNCDDGAAHVGRAVVVFVVGNTIAT